MIQPDDPRLRLCVVTDDLRDGIDGLVGRMRTAVDAGATMVLLRLKHADARTLVEAGRALVQGVRVPVLIRDRLDVALITGAAGVHLSEGSMPVQAVRTQAPPGLLIAASVSTASDIVHVSDADFITVGPVYGRDGTGLGFDGLRALTAQLRAPAVAVGGLTPEHLPALRQAGASGVMLVQLPQSAPDITSYVSAFVNAPERTATDSD